MRDPDVLFGERATSALVHGFRQVCEVAARTLGPAQGIVLSQPATGTSPEALADAATIARRIFALPDRAEDVGAMLARNMIWRMQARTGDGAATAAVIGQQLLAAGLTYTAAGGNAMAFRAGVASAVATAAAALRASAVPAEGRETLRAIAEGITAEPAISEHLADVFAEIGPDAYVRIDKFVAPYVDHEFQAGAQWSGRLASQYMVTDRTASTAELPISDVALFDGEVTELDQVRPLLELAADSANRGLLLVANEIGGQALTTLVANHHEDGKRIAAVALQRPPVQRDTDYEDLAVFTSATVLSPRTGRTLEGIRRDDLGAATKAIAGDESLVTMCGEERADDLAGQVQAIRDRLEKLPEGDDARRELQMRGARLAGQTAILKIGAHTESQRAFLQSRAEKALRALPLAMNHGVVPGGGAAYVHCASPAGRPDKSKQTGESAGTRAVGLALAAPFLRIAANTGVSSPPVVLDEVRRRGSPHGYDAMSHSIRDMRQAGIMDPVDVLIAALETAASGALLALTVGAVVLRRNPETDYEP